MPNAEYSNQRSAFPGAILYVSDVAKLRRISNGAARAWLAALEKQHGDAVVRRIGKKLCTTEGGLARVLPGATPEPTVARKLSSLERRFARLAHHVQSLTAAVHDLRVGVMDYRASCGKAVQDGRFGGDVKIDMP